MSDTTTDPIKLPVAAPVDVLTDILREGARRLLADAVEAEVDAWIAHRADIRDDHGRRLVVRNGRQPERTIQSGLGPVSVRKPRVHDRRSEAERESFESMLLPPYMRRTESLDALIPYLYLRGVSTGDFNEALEAILGRAPGLSAATVSRMIAGWQDEQAEWSRRRLEGTEYVYIWADGVYFNIRLADDDTRKQCILVLMGATAEGRKELIAVGDGDRESKDSWLEVIRDLKRRGMSVAPKLAIGDGALGFWAAVRQEWPGAAEQRCWVHKTGNVLTKLPKSRHAKAKAGLQEIWNAPTRKEAETAFDAFVEDHEAKYPKASECLRKDREELLSFYRFPAEHWKHL